MISEWNLRDEIIAITHNWPWPMLAFLFGCLVGWAFSYLFPTQYRAETRITVAYNADAVYHNPDDYKNWQMKQLDTLTEAPDVLDETLKRLRSQNPFWNSITMDDLTEMLHASWRNTGVWRLSAADRDQERAVEAAEVWTQVVLETYTAASSSAGDLMMLDKKLNQLNWFQAQSQARVAELEATKITLSSWQDTKAGTQAGPLDPTIRWQILAYVAQAADFTPAWQSMLNDFPNADNPARDYQDWLERVIALINAEVDTLTRQVEDLEIERSAAYVKYNQAAEDSRGMSATLVVERPFLGVWQIEALRPTSLIVLVGGFLGMLVWGLVWLIRINFRRPSEDAPG